jgi:hypothetical protein
MAARAAISTPRLVETPPPSTPNSCADEKFDASLRQATCRAAKRSKNGLEIICGKSSPEPH